MYFFCVVEEEIINCVSVFICAQACAYIPHKMDIIFTILGYFTFLQLKLLDASYYLVEKDQM